VSPGIYQIDTPLLVAKPGQVLLGLGLATLVSAKQNTIIQVGDVAGVRVAGFLLQAGPAAGMSIGVVVLVIMVVGGARAGRERERRERRGRARGEGGGM
jgi:hypothetical protein